MKSSLKMVLLSSVLLAGVVACSPETPVNANGVTASGSANTPAVVRKPVIAKVVIPSGTQLTVLLIDGIHSDTSAAGDTFMTSLAEDLVVNGATVLEKGTSIAGRVVDAEGSGRVKGRASVRLVLTGISKNGRMIPITTDTYSATAAGTQKRDAEVIGGGAGIGAVIGAIAGGKKGAGVGAVVGGGGGTGVVLGTKGKEIHYGPETRLNFTLSNLVEL